MKPTVVSLEVLLICRKQREEAQKAYCEVNNFPLFVPMGGSCYNCHRNVYDWWGVETCGRMHITGCPVCNTSFCE